MSKHVRQLPALNVYLSSPLSRVMCHRLCGVTILMTSWIALLSESGSHRGNTLLARGRHCSKYPMAGKYKCRWGSIVTTSQLKKNICIYE